VVNRCGRLLLLLLLRLLAGVEKYTTAVAALFDPAVSKADLIASEVSGPNSITLRWRLEGKLKIGEQLSRAALVRTCTAVGIAAAAAAAAAAGGNLFCPASRMAHVQQTPSRKCC
jgi:hypothetical protein